MESKKTRSLLFAGAITAVVGAGFYFLYKNCKKEKLSSWLEEYIEEVEKKIKSHNGDALSLETIASIINLLTEIEEFIFGRDYSNVDQLRVGLLRKEGYEDAVVQSIEFHEKSFDRANRILEKRLNVNLQELKEVFTQHGEKSGLKELLESTKKPYLSLPVLEKDSVKKAYIAYVSQLVQHDKVDKNNQLIVKAKPEFREMSMHIYYVNKYIAKDTLVSQFGIEDKYFPQLLAFHNLVDDHEIKTVKEELKNLHSNK